MTQLLGTSAANLEQLEASVRERDALLALKARRTQQTALDEEEQAALRTLERERNARMRAESELALARTRSAEKKAQLAAAKAQLAMLQRSSAGVPSDPLQPLLELKQAASRIPDQDAAVQELKMLQQERERLLEMKQRSQLENAQLSDPLDAPRTPQLRQAIAEHDAELDRIRSSSKGALPSRSSSSLGTAASQEDLEAEALLAQYEAELYSEELQASGGEETAATEAVLMRTASGSLIEEANRLIATTSRRLIELEHERAARVGSPPTTARSTVAPSTRSPNLGTAASAEPSGGDGSSLMKIARVKMPASDGKSSLPPSLESYGIELTEALQVLAVHPGSAAAAVPAGATLREITGYPVESLDDIEQALDVLPGQLRGAGLEFVFTYAAQTSMSEGVPPIKASAVPANRHVAATVPRREKDSNAAVDAERVEESPATAPLKYGSDPPRSGRARTQVFGDPLAMHKPRAQGRRKAPARGLLATRKKQGRH